MQDNLSELLQTVRVDGAHCLRAELTAPWGCLLEQSPHTLFYICVSGSAHLEIAASKQIVVLQAGDCALVPHGSAHTLRDSASSPIVREIPDAQTDERTGLPTIRCGGGGGMAILIALELQLDRARAKTLMRFLPHMIHVPGEDGRLPSWARPLAEAGDIEIARRGPGSTAALTRLTEMLFIQMVRVAAQRLAETTAHRSSQTHWSPQVVTAIRLIREQPGTRWSVAKLAAEVGMSRSAFAAAFTREMETPPMQYLATQRMLRAVELLRTPGVAISEIAFQVGYESHIAFARGFKRHHGIGPAAYRRMTQLKMMSEAIPDQRLTEASQIAGQATRPMRRPRSA